MTYKKYRLALLIFGTLCLIYNIFEFVIGKYSTKQGVIFVIECLAGIALIFLPEIIEKLFKIVLPEKIIYFYWFFFSDLGLSRNIAAHDFHHFFLG